MTTLLLKQITVDPTQPRQEFEPESMERLKSSIKKQGILNPLLVEKRNGQYLLIDGERRFRTAQSLGLKEVPVQIVGSMSDTERMMKRIHIQTQVENWSTFDRARAYRFIKDSLELSPQQLANELGMARSTVTNYIDLLTISKRNQQIIIEKRIPYEYLVETSRVVRQVEDGALGKKLEDAIVNQVITGVIKKQKEIRTYAMAIKARGDKIATKIVENKNYSPYQAMKDANLKPTLDLRSIMTQVKWLTFHLKNADVAVAKEMTRRDSLDLGLLNDYIHKLTESSGFVSDEE